MVQLAVGLALFIVAAILFLGSSTPGDRYWQHVVTGSYKVSGEPRGGKFPGCAGCVAALGMATGILVILDAVWRIVFP